MEDILATIAALSPRIVLHENKSTINDNDLQLTEHDESEQIALKLYATNTTLASTTTIWSGSTQIFLIVLYVLTFLATLLGNVVVIAVPRKAPLLFSPPFENIRKYILNLASSDIVIGVLCAPFIYVDIIMGKWIFPFWLCPVIQFGQLVSVCFSTITLMAISLERYTAFLYPESRFYKMLKSSSSLIVMCAWTLALLSVGIPLHNFDWNDSNKLYNHLQCTNFVGIEATDRKLLISINFGLTYALPAIGITLAYTSIIKVLIYDSTIGQRLKIKRFSKTVKMIFAIIVLHGLCWTPIKVYQLAHVYNLIPCCTEQQFNMQLYLHTAFHWLAMAGSAAHPVVYTFSSQAFWIIFTRLLPPLYTIYFLVIYIIILLWDGMVTCHFNRYMDQIGVSQKLQAYIQAQTLKRTCESVMVDVRSDLNRRIDYDELSNLFDTL